MHDLKLCAILERCGMTRRRALWFALHLDDARPVGVSAAVLAYYLSGEHLARKEKARQNLESVRQFLYGPNTCAGDVAIPERTPPAKAPKNGRASRRVRTSHPPGGA